MQLNIVLPAPPRKPNLLELAQFTSPTGLLPSTLVPLLPLKQIKRRIRKINATHPQYQEEMPLVLAYEAKLCGRLNGRLEVALTQPHLT
jgi:hypothetical protein